MTWDLQRMNSSPNLPPSNIRDFERQVNYFQSECYRSLDMGYKAMLEIDGRSLGNKGTLT
jgi:hypothetical protein